MDQKFFIFNASTQIKEKHFLINFNPFQKNLGTENGEINFLILQIEDPFLLEDKLKHSMTTSLSNDEIKKLLQKLRQRPENKVNQKNTQKQDLC
jgi:hypothetical protein